MPGYKWTRWTSSLQWSSSSRQMISIGRDGDGENLVVGRARHERDTLPAKVKPAHNIAYVCYGGVEHIKRDFEVLMPTEFHWTHSRNGHVPDHAVEAGRTADGEMLYVARVYHNGIPCGGKVQPSHRVAYIPFAGRELSYNEYEVLVQS